MKATPNSYEQGFFDLYNHLVADGAAVRLADLPDPNLSLHSSLNAFFLYTASPLPWVSQPPHCPAKLPLLSTGRVGLGSLKVDV